MVGIYDAKTGEVLERCNLKHLPSAIKQWKELGYKVRVGAAFPNLMILSR
jgi:hypothetical protein